jgi:hypothetical protein
MSINRLAAEKAANVGSVEVPTNTAPSKDDVLNGLTKYIPTESITLYIATVSAQQALKSIGLTPAFAYWFFVALTPLLFITLFLQQLAV